MKRLTSLAVVVVLLGGGCFSKPPKSPDPIVPPTAPAEVTEPAPAATSTPATAPTTAKPSTIVKPKTPPPAPKPANGYVTIKDMKFGPQILAVNVGATVTWTNKDSVNHTVDSDAVRIFNSGNIPVGGSFSHTFKATGTYTYYCGVHPSMKGTIVVN